MCANATDLQLNQQSAFRIRPWSIGAKQNKQDRGRQRILLYQDSQNQLVAVLKFAVLYLDIHDGSIVLANSFSI